MSKDLDSISYTLSATNLHIEDSYKVRAKDMGRILKAIRKEAPTESVFDHRGIMGMVMEWCTHNVLYRLGIERERVGSVDLDLGEKPLRMVAYYIIGMLSYIFL